MVTSLIYIGIPAEELPKLFKRFYRITETSGRSNEGSGIGLAMVDELVRMHGGTINVYSQIARGTVFVVTLPYGKKKFQENFKFLLGYEHLPLQLVTHSKSSSQRRLSYVRSEEWWLDNNFDVTQTAVNNNNKPRVLIVDDNSDMREYLYNLLRK